MCVCVFHTERKVRSNLHLWRFPGDICCPLFDFRGLLGMSPCLAPWFVYLEPLFLSLLITNQRVSSMKSAVEAPLLNPKDLAQSLRNSC